MSRLVGVRVEVALAGGDGLVFCVCDDEMVDRQEQLVIVFVRRAIEIKRK